MKIDRYAILLRVALKTQNPTQSLYMRMLLLTRKWKSRSNMIQLGTSSNISGNYIAFVRLLVVVTSSGKYSMHASEQFQQLIKK
jgi:hypothetical protein